MMRLIDANELKEHLFVGADYDKAIDDGIAKTEEEVFAFQCGWNDALKSVVQFAPTVDAVEVVRCRDCKWYHNADDKYFPRTCDHWSEMFYHYEDWESVDENGFCSWGERREDETD